MVIVYLDDLELQVNNLKVENVKDKRKITFDFKVTSEAYHDVTTKLYENSFQVTIPEENLAFPATIFNYATSVTDLYQAGTVGDYHLELVETL